jgi:hypothetical protein
MKKRRNSGRELIGRLGINSWCWAEGGEEEGLVGQEGDQDQFNSSGAGRHGEFYRAFPRHPPPGTPPRPPSDSQSLRNHGRSRIIPRREGPAKWASQRPARDRPETGQKGQRMFRALPVCQSSRSLICGQCDDPPEDILIHLIDHLSTLPPTESPVSHP